MASKYGIEFGKVEKRIFQVLKRIENSFRGFHNHKPKISGIIIAY